MTLNQACILTGFTGKTLTVGRNWGDFQDYASELIGRPLFTHELSFYADEIKEKAGKDFENKYESFDKKELAIVEIVTEFSLLHEDEKHIVREIKRDLPAEEIIRRFYKTCCFPHIEDESKLDELVKVDKKRIESNN